MSRLRAALTRRRQGRAYLRDQRAISRALAAAPTVESRHEIAVLVAGR
jgi:hypothetical protein